TAFQWVGQDSPETLEEKKELLFSIIKPHKKIKFKWTDPQVSRLEAVFARGDRRLAEVVEEAFRRGAKLDPWSEYRDMDVWQAAFTTTGIDPAQYANRDFPIGEPLPWSHLDTGLSEEYFRKEYQLSLEGEVTGDCKVSRCLLCGLDPKTCFQPGKPKDPEPGETMAPPMPEPSPSAAPPVKFKYRLTYHKKESGKFHSHLETMAIIQRAFRAAGLEVAHSEGFHPQPRISFGPALPVGVESAEELLDVELLKYMEPWTVSGKLNTSLPDGFHFVEATQIGPKEKSISAATHGFTFRVKLHAPDRETFQLAVDTFMAAASVPVQREGKKEKDIRPMVESLLLEPESMDLIFITKIDPTGGFARPDEVVMALFPKRDVAVERMVKLSAHMN
ncbi:MAG: TIGR03936 family radical SAM-associated protein, partial [Nitrospinota bacterium]|nr:TIGR03936 family radical SAM-associated protein [Nitrospinota bacterium]